MKVVIKSQRGKIKVRAGRLGVGEGRGVKGDVGADKHQGPRLNFYYIFKERPNCLRQLN